MEKLIFDIESTGLSTDKDRIVQLAIQIIDEEEKVILHKSKMYNPGIPISQTAQDAHGITDKMVKNCPYFEEDAKKLKKLFENKIIIGFNILRFDIPLLLNEFERAGVNVELSGQIIDVLNIEKKLHKNNLSDVYKRYTGKDLKDAHSADADVEATSTILNYQIRKISESGCPDIDDALYELSGTKDIVDYYGKLKRDEDGYLIFNFGKKCMGKRVVDEMDYATWVLSEKFPNQIKQLIREECAKVNKKVFKKQTSLFKKPEPPIDDLPF